MGKLSYTTAQVNEGIRKSIDRCVCVVANETDNPDTVTFSAGEVGTYKLVPLTLATVLMNQFVTYQNGSQYKGSATRNFIFNGTAVVGVSTTNVTVHFRLAVNGTLLPRTTSAVKLDSTTARSTIDASTGGTLNTDDILQIYASVDKACSIDVYHTQLQLLEV